MVLVRELEVRYNYSGVKNFWREIRVKITRPLSFRQNDFHFQTRFYAEPTQQIYIVVLLRFLYGNEIESFTLLQIYYFKKGYQ